MGDLTEASKKALLAGTRPALRRTLGRLAGGTSCNLCRLIQGTGKVTNQACFPEWGATARTSNEPLTGSSDAQREWVGWQLR